VINQTFKNIQIIIVNDGSTDSSSNICEMYRDQDPRIILIHQENQGLSVARNTGLEKAYSKYVCFLDSDDYWNRTDFLNDLFHENSRNEDIILFGIQKFYENSKKINNYSDFNFELKDECDTLKLCIDKRIYISSACNKFYKTQFIKDNKLTFKPKVTSEDIEWSGRILTLRFSYYILSDSPYIYRQRGNSISSFTDKKKLSNLLENFMSLLIYTNNRIIECEEALKSYLGFQLGVIIYNLAIFDSKTKREYKTDIINNIKLLKFSNDLRIRIISKSFPIFGYGLTLFLIKAYLVIKKVWRFN